MDETMFPGQRPAIGVRAIVDGRDSLRPAHTGPARALARQVCELLRQTVRYGDGEPVRCVLADEAVGSAQDALRAQEQFRAQNVGAVISVARAWSYPFEVMCLDDRLPQLVWGFSGSDAPGTVFMAAATSTAAQHGLPFFKVYGRDIRPAADTHIPPDVAQQLVQFAQCALAVATMRGRTYLRLGNTCMGIGASMPDEHFFRAYLGMRVQSMDMTGLLHRMQAGIYDRQEFETARAWVREHCREMEDPNPPQLRLSPAEKERVWDDSVRMALIFRDLMDGNPRLADAFGPEAAAGHAALTASFQGQRQWTDFLPTADFAEGILNSGFDWNGPRRPHPVATENDALQAAAMLFGTLLTGAAQLFCDVRGYWSPAAMEERLGRRGADVPDGFLYLTNSGSMALDGSMEALRGGSPAIKPFWELTAQDAARCAAATRWGPAKRGVFRAGGFSASFRARGGVPLTMVRLNLVKGLGPALQIAEGRTADLEPALAQAAARQTDPTWPQVFFVPRLTDRFASSSVYRVIERWGSNHCVLCPGHVGGQLVTLASMLRIPVSFHNLAPEQLMRPDVWRQFGADDPTGADYRACAAFGPLYGRY